MHLALSVLVGLLIAIGVYLMLRASLLRLVLGLVEDPELEEPEPLLGELEVPRKGAEPEHL